MPGLPQLGFYMAFILCLAFLIPFGLVASGLMGSVPVMTRRWRQRDIKGNLCVSNRAV
jgi:hypothetical protein